LAGAYRWYEEQRGGLGEEFLTAVDVLFDTIEQFPEMFARVHGEVGLLTRPPHTTQHEALHRAQLLSVTVPGLTAC
jgi:hypothetical protein